MGRGAVNTAIHAVPGGLASLAGGGKFAEGATNAAYAYLFNFLGHCASTRECMKREGYEPTQYPNGAVCNSSMAGCPGGVGTDEETGRSAAGLMSLAAAPLAVPLEGAAALSLVPRALMASDLGLVGTVTELNGTIALVGTELRLTVDMIAGRFSMTMAQATANLNALAASAGALSIDIQATQATPALARALQMQGWTVTAGRVAPYTDTITKAVK